MMKSIPKGSWITCPNKHRIAKAAETIHEGNYVLPKLTGWQQREALLGDRIERFGACEKCGELWWPVRWTEAPDA